MSLVEWVMGLLLIALPFAAAALVIAWLWDKPCAPLPWDDDAGEL